MSNPKPIPKYKLYLLIFLGLVVLVFLLGYKQVLGWGVEQGLQKVASKLSEPVSTDQIEVKGLADVHIHKLQIGAKDSPRVTVDSIVFSIDWPALLKRKIGLATLQLESPTLYLRKGESSGGIVDTIKQKMGGEKSTKSKGSSRILRVSTEIPQLRVVNGKLVDPDNIIQIVDGNLSLLEGQLHADARVLKPDVQKCSIQGTIAAFDVSCQKPIVSPVIRGFQVQVPRLRMIGQQLRLVDVQLSYVAKPVPMALTALQHIRADVAVDFQKNQAGKRPFLLHITARDGASIIGRGELSSQELAIMVQAANFPIDLKDKHISTSISGNYGLRVQLQKKQAEMNFGLRFSDIIFDHRKLSTKPVGPFSLQILGKANLTVHDLATKAVVFAMPKGKVLVEQVAANFAVHVDTTPERRNLHMKFDTGMLDAGLVAQAIPSGLIPDIGPLEAEGLFRMDGDIDFSEDRLEEAIFDIRTHLDEVTILKKNERLDFDKLAKIFSTEFKADNRRTTGPGSKRWTYLDSMPEVLPFVVTNQEDGRFFHHYGVRNRHLRSSLIDNLQRGRFFRGGSTITMQLSRNLYLFPRKTLARKFQEVILSWMLEKHFREKYGKKLGKRKMMEIYLNIVEFGPKVYGVRDAARFFFKKIPKMLTIHEMCWLIRRLPKPKRWRVSNPVSKYDASSINDLVKRLHKRGFIPAEQAVLLEEGQPWPGMEAAEPKEDP